MCPIGKISTAKLAQALEFGAVVIEMGDNFDQAFQMLRELTDELGLYLVNSLNPFRLEGQKTIVFEILEQRDWRFRITWLFPAEISEMFPRSEKA